MRKSVSVLSCEKSAVASLSCQRKILLKYENKLGDRGGVKQFSNSIIAQCRDLSVTSDILLSLVQ